jgi:hypothetical protein
MGSRQGAKVTMPFANMDISFGTFLFIAPLVLIALSFYLHILIGHWTNLSHQHIITSPSSAQISGADLSFFVGYGITLSHQHTNSSPSTSKISGAKLPFIFNLNYRTAVVLSTLLFYALVPAILGLFAWKAMPRPRPASPLLLALTATSMAVFAFLLLHHRRNPTHNILSWFLRLIIIVGIVATGGALISLHLSTTTNLLSRQLELYGADLGKTRSKPYRP